MARGISSGEPADPLGFLARGIGHVHGLVTELETRTASLVGSVPDAGTETLTFLQELDRVRQCLEDLLRAAASECEWRDTGGARPRTAQTLRLGEMQALLHGPPHKPGPVTDSGNDGDTGETGPDMIDGYDAGPAGLVDLFPHRGGDGP